MVPKKAESRVVYLAFSYVLFQVLLIPGFTAVCAATEILGLVQLIPQMSREVVKFLPVAKLRFVAPTIQMSRPVTQVSGVVATKVRKYQVEAQINTRTLKKRCALVARTEVKQTQEL